MLFLQFIVLPHNYLLRNCYLQQIPAQYPDLIANSKPLNQAEENALEFTNPQIPHILALLGPQQHSGIFRLSADFVSVS
jgi:hypothetical protein